SANVPTGSTSVPADVSTSVAPAGVSNKSKTPMVEEDITAAKRLHDEEQAQVERQRAELQRKRQQEVLASAIMAALFKRKKQALAEKLANERMDRPMTQGQQRTYMRHFVKNKSCAVYSTGWSMARVKSFTDDQLKEEFEKIQKDISNIQIQAFSRTLKRIGPVLEEPSSKMQKSTEAPIPYVPEVPQSPVVSSPTFSGTRRKSFGRKHLPKPKSKLQELDLDADDQTFIKVVSNKDSKDEAPHLWSALVGWEDLVTLYGLVVKYYENHPVAAAGLILWGDLQVLFDSHEGGKGSFIWHHQHLWQIRSWRLYTLSNVHVLETVYGEVVYMFADVPYPLSVKLMERMLKHKLAIERDVVGNDMTTTEQLIQLIKNQLAAAQFAQNYRVFNSPMLHLLRVEMVINSPWIMPILGTKELASPEQTAPVPPEGQANPSDIVTTHQAWVKAQKENSGLMPMTVEPDIQKNLEHLDAYDMLKELKMLRSRKLKPRALSLYVGDGHCTTVEAIGDYHLCLTSGLDLILHICHYAPSITRGIVSSSCLYKDGFVNHFENDNSTFVFKNNMIYFNAIPRDDIYEIVVSSSNTNESFVYVITNKRANLNLDSALLWHCRLGHVNKKLIEKLQHDGLLDSTDIKSFEKCVACMSGKMARKPYSHQVERAKDLLGLIHTDVCSPFKIMSRQGASYFVTFTDDFSRSVYVYFLKHKNEVFNTFKVFQKEVENKLEKSIKSLRSDREGEYMSQEFLDHLKDHGIIAHRTPPYTQQHNGVSERRNRTLLGMVRSMMSQTTLPKSFWDYALESVARVLNMVLTKKVDKTPYEMQSMKDNKVWELVDLPLNGKTVGHKWLLKKKTDMDGAVHTYKARLVAKGFTQTLGIDYVETFSPVADIRAIRILIAITAFYDYEIWLMDVKTVFLNGYLNEEVYMEQNEGNMKRELKISCYTDAGYLTDVDDMKSQTGYVFVLNGGTVDWKSTKQSIFATSSTDAEYIAAFDASKEAVWIRKFISRLGVVPTIKKPINMYYDNTEAI
nr:hypothetical protein [Tanacetum cinerariifolium]